MSAGSGTGVVGAPLSSPIVAEVEDVVSPTGFEVLDSAGESPSPVVAVVGMPGSSSTSLVQAPSRNTATAEAMNASGPRRSLDLFFNMSHLG